MNVLDLFSGIGGFSLGLERAGMRTVAFCEIDPYCRAVLAKHWPGVPCYDDIRTLTAARLAADGIRVDVICGGFPCQDISFAGDGAGLAGERSGLWREYKRLISEIRPKFVIVENVAALLARGLGDVLGDLAALRYDAEWHCIPASAVGAPHRRDRVWIVGHTNGNGKSVGTIHAEAPWLPRAMADAIGDGLQGERHGRDIEQTQEHDARRQAAGTGDAALGDAKRAPADLRAKATDAAQRREIPAREPGWWLTEPDVGRVADGVPARVDRLRSLGNAVVPQIPEIIGRAIMRAAHYSRDGIQE